MYSQLRRIRIDSIVESNSNLLIQSVPTHFFRIAKISFRAGHKRPLLACFLKSNIQFLLYSTILIHELQMTIVLIFSNIHFTEMCTNYCRVT
jgi:hypothetical protein